MALTWDQISSISEKKILPKMIDNIFDSNPILQRLKKNSYQSVNGGTSILQPVNYAQATAVEWYSGADVLDTTDNDTGTAFEYTWKQLNGTISISELDEIKNSGDAAKLKFVQQKTKVVEKTMQDTLGAGLFSAGTNAKSIVGLRVFGSTSNSVGGISQTTYTWAAAQVDSTTTTLSIPALQVIHNRCTIGSDGPTVAVTTRALYNSLYGLLQPQQRFQDSETAKAGFQSIMFNGIPVVVDSHAIANGFWFLNEDYLQLCYHPDHDFKFGAFQKPINQHVRSAQIDWAGAFTTSNPRMLGYLSALTA